MRKQLHKRKKTVIDVIDGKIINDNEAIKISNIDVYLEKNGYKAIKLFILLLIISAFIPSVHAVYDASYMTKLDLSILSNVYLLIGLIILSLVLIIIGILQNTHAFYMFGNILLFFIGLILTINGFVVVLSIIMTILPLISIFLWKGE
jgi:hypothetical protein